MKLTIHDIPTPNNIWNYKQNHPELVVKDVCEVFPNILGLATIVRRSLLIRGINKWLKVRRDLIAYKKGIKHDIRRLNGEVRQLKSEMNKLYCLPDHPNYRDYRDVREKYLINKNELLLLEKIRSDLKNLCMTERFQVWEGKRLEDMNTLRVGGN